MLSRFHDTAKILLAASPVWAVMPAAVDRVPVGHVITATHGLLRQRVQGIGPLDISGTDVDDGAILVHQIDLRANANATEYPTERPLDCGWPDLRRHFVHVDADECLAGLADRLRDFVF